MQVVCPASKDVLSYRPAPLGLRVRQYRGSNSDSGHREIGLLDETDKSTPISRWPVSSLKADLDSLLSLSEDSQFFFLNHPI